MNGNDGSFLLKNNWRSAHITCKWQLEVWFPLDYLQAYVIIDYHLNSDFSSLRTGYWLS